jgi:ABC-2 type transport system permease protein
MSTLAPLSLMLRHEVRLNWRVMSARVSHKLLVGSLIGLLALMHLVALPFPFVLAEMPALPRVDVLAAVTGAGACALVIMISTALIGTVKLIYSRADMDLLLSSPVPAQAIVVVRVLTIVFGILCIAGLLILPGANIMAVFGYPGFLIAYVALLCLALTATAIGVLLAQGLFCLLGARRTRLFAQIFAGLLGIGFLFLVNLHNILPESAWGMALRNLTNLAAYFPAADSWVWWPARAALGEPLPFLIAVVLCTGLFTVTTFGLANRLIDNAIAANGSAAKTVKMRGSSHMLAPRGGPVTIMRRKEWLLIGRDPWLMTQIAQQLLVMLPCLFLVWKSGAGATYMWLVVVFLAGHLAGALAWLTVSTEEAPDLLATAPVRRRDVLWAKLQAALVPTAVIAAGPVALAWSMNAWLGFTVLLCSAGSALSTSLLHVRYPSTAKRSELAWRGASNKVLPFVEMLLGLTWVVLGLLMLLLGWWGMLPLVFVVPVAYCMMR